MTASPADHCPADAPRLRVRRNNTICRKADFARIFADGRRFRTRLLTIVVHVPLIEEQPFRAAFVTSRKVGGATVRNRVRRRLREACRLLPLPLRRPVDLVVIAQPAAANATFHELCAALHDALGRAGVISPDKEGEQGCARS